MEGPQGSPLSPALWDRGEGDSRKLWGPLHRYGMEVERPMGVPVIPNPIGQVSAEQMGLGGGDSGTLGAPFIAYGLGVGGTPGCTC